MSDGDVSVGMSREAGEPREAGKPRIAGQKRKGAGCLRWLGRVALGGVILLLGLSAIGAIYQAIASTRDAKTYKPLDQMVNVNGIQMRLDCRGSGSPTAILEAGAGGSSSSWVLVQDEVSKFARVCSYDRPGMGWSDVVRKQIPPEQVGTMLHDLLANAGEEPPYLMVAHSLGGIYVRAFTVEYPDDVVGMVLVDSSHENQNQYAPPEYKELEKIQVASLWSCRIGAPIGLFRAFKLLDASVSTYPLTEEQKETMLVELYRSGICGTLARESDMFTAWGSQPRELKDLGNMPLIVLSAKTDAQKMYDQLPPSIKQIVTLEMKQQEVKIGEQLQGELAALSTNSKHIIVEETSHNIQLDKPQLVIDAIREVFEQVAK